MKQTAVEWFEEKISKYISYNYEKAYEQHDEVNKIFEKAKAMEKEQITDAYNNGQQIPPFEYAEQYYNETYGK